MVTIRLGWVWIPILIFFGVPFVVRTAADWIRMGRGAVTGWRAVRRGPAPDPQDFESEEAYNAAVNAWR